MGSHLRDKVSRWVDLAAVTAAGLLLFRIYAVYAHVGLQLNHDEAEHMHVAYALERGEKPYLDFIENHPMLFNLGILALKRMFANETVLGLYMLVRLWVFLAFTGCLYYVFRLGEDYCRRERSSFNAASLLSLVFLLFGIFPASKLWDVRPDWFCYLLSLACIHAHYRVHCRTTEEWTARDYATLAFGGMAGGLASAVLAKSLHIFVPYALVLSMIFVHRMRASRPDLKRLCAANALFVGAGILAFCLAVAGEIYATGATLDAYYQANYVINRKVHLVDSLRETPASQLAAIAALGLWPLLAAASASGALLLMSYKKRRYLQCYLLIFAFLLIGFNTLLLVSTNGAFWSHNFAPSFLGFLLIGFVLLHSLLVWLVRASEGMVRWPFARNPPLVLSPLIGYSAALLFVAWMGFSFLTRMDDVIRDRENLQLSRTIRKLMSDGQPAELLADRLLPSDLTYLVITPRAMPLRARHWGYYFMLGTDMGFWKDTHALGIGPDAETHWRSLYAISPPDAVLFFDIIGDYLTVKESLMRNQGVDISWFEAALKREYICVTRPGLVIHVRPEHLAKLSDRKWKRCEP